MSLKRHHDVKKLWQKQAHSHAMKTGVQHLKNGDIAFILFKNVLFGPMRNLLLIPKPGHITEISP